MGLFDVTQIALQRALEGAGLRQQAISNNLANVNAPGFKRSDVDFHSSLSAALAGGETAVAAVPFTVQTDSSTSMRADGNNVDVDQEMANLTQNASEYQALAAIAKSRLQMIQTAIGNR
ncbi:MAG: flagellar basal body rod protein FlgB [Gaiellaceae bacterium]